MEMDSVREWEAQFKGTSYCSLSNKINSYLLYNYYLIFTEKYDLVGRLLKPGEQPTNYSDEEDEAPAAGGDKAKDD